MRPAIGYSERIVFAVPLIILRKVLGGDMPCKLKHREGVTLVELLVATAVTLVMMAAVVTAFGVINDAISHSRATVEMTDRLRVARDRLQRDLDSVTATMIPPLRPSADEGYFEYVEGPMSEAILLGVYDRDRNGDPRTDIPGQTVASASIIGDTDDSLYFTVRTRGQPFAARLSDGTVIESDVAEIVYFVSPAIIEPRQMDALGPGEPAALYRIVRPVIPRLNDPGLPYRATREQTVSQRFEASGTGGGARTWRFNSLGDLTKPENRVGHLNPAYQNGRGANFFQFPYVPDFTRTGIDLVPNSTSDDTNAFLDVLIPGVLSFDVQAYDPLAPLLSDPNDPNGRIVYPTDPGYVTLARQFRSRNQSNWPVIVARGAYVDLNYMQATVHPAIASPSDYDPNDFRMRQQDPLYSFPQSERPHFSGLPHRKSLLWSPVAYPNIGKYWEQLAGSTGSATPPVPGAFPGLNGIFQNPPPGPAVYDTWSFHYEHDGVDTDGDGLIDEGTNDLDDDGINGVDDLEEHETSPPYPAPLRGIRVILRVIEPDTKVVRQVTVYGEFLPD